MSTIQNSSKTDAQKAIQKAEHLHIRASERDKRTLSQAAQIKNLSISQFLLQSVLPLAEEILEAQAEAEAREAPPQVQTVFTLSEVEWEEFERLLDAPPRELPELKRLLSSRPVWEV